MTATTAAPATFASAIAGLPADPTVLAYAGRVMNGLLGDFMLDIGAAFVLHSPSADAPTVGVLVDARARARMVAFVTAHRAMMSLVTGITIDPLEFEDGDAYSPAAGRNAIKAMQYQSYALWTYTKVYEIAARQMPDV